MPGIRAFTCCDCNSIVETTHSPGLHDDCECNMDFLGSQYDRYNYKRFLYPQNIKWMQCRYPGISKKTSFKKNLTAIHSPPWWNLNTFNKISLGSLNLCTSDEYQQDCTRLSSLEMKRAVGLVYPCYIDDNSQNKRKLKSTTNFRDGKKPKELTTVYKRECDMTSLSTSDSGTLCSSIQTQREILQVPSVNLKYNTPETMIHPDNNMECCLVERVIPFKRDNTGYFEVVSPNDNFMTKRHRKLRRKHKKNKVQFTTTTVTTPVSEGLQEKKIHNKKDVHLTQVTEYNSAEAPNNYVSEKSYHSIIRTTYTPDDIENVNYETKRIATLKEDVKRVSFLELDKFPTKINKDVDPKRVNDIKMEDKSLSAHLSLSSDDGKLTPSVTKTLNELLLDPEHEKVIKNVLHCLARKAAIRKSLSNTILELKGKEKLGVSKRKSSGSIQNVSSSDLDRLHFEKYKASVDVAIKTLEDRMTKKIYDAVKSKEHKRKRKEDYYKDNVTRNIDKDNYVNDCKLESQNSLDSFKDLAGAEKYKHFNLDDEKIIISEKPYPNEDMRTTLAYNCHVKPSKSPFKKNHEYSNHPRQNAFIMPVQNVFYQNQSKVVHPINSPEENVANNFEKDEETAKKDETCLKKTESKTKIANSTVQLSNNELTPILQNCEEMIETNSKILFSSNEDSMDSNNRYSRSFREMPYIETKKRREEKHPRETSPNYQVNRFKHKKYHISPTRDESYTCDVSAVSEHPRNLVQRDSINYCNISPPRNYRDNTTRHKDGYQNGFEERDVILSPQDTSISEKDTYGSQNKDNGRSPRIQESKENKPTKIVQPNNYKRYDRFSEYQDKPINRKTIEKVDALFNKNKHLAALDYNQNHSSNSSAVTRTSQHEINSDVSKQLLTPPITSSNEDEKIKKSNQRSPQTGKLGQEIKTKCSESTNRSRRPPPYDDYEDSGDFNEYVIPEYYYDYTWHMRPYQNSPIGRYDNLSYMNRIQSKNYPSARTSEESVHDPYSYGPIYSEQIKYTCKFQGAENANLISFVIFLMLFVGLFQYLNIHIT